MSTVCCSGKESINFIPFAVLFFQDVPFETSTNYGFVDKFKAKKELNHFTLSNRRESPESFRKANLSSYSVAV